MVDTINTKAWDGRTQAEYDSPSTRSGAVILDEDFKTGTAQQQGEYARGFYVGGSGNVVYEEYNGNVVIANGLLGGIYYPFACKRILSSGTDGFGTAGTTTATNLLWLGGGTTVTK